MALGMCGLPFLWATARVAVYLTIGAVLLGLDLSNTDWVGFVAMILAIAAAMSALGIATGAVVIVSKRGNTISGMVLLAMGMLGGAVFPIAVLPSWLQEVGRFVPTRFAFDGLRDALYQGAGWGGDALILGAIGVAALPLSIWAFSRGVHHARRAGSLSQY